MNKGLGGLIKQAQQMQAKIAELQEQMALRTVEASAGGGMVTAVVNGKQEVVSIRIEREVVDPEDVEMLQDLVLAAVNEALEKSQELAAQRLGAVTGGMKLPGLM